MNTSLNTLSQAILQTAAYSDIFDYPLTESEIHRYLTGMKASLVDVRSASNKILIRTGEYYSLPGRQEIVDIRRQREARSQMLLPYALRYGKILGALPFVRMVGLTGSLAVMNVSKNADFDYMLVTAKGRVWMARLFAMAVNRIAKLFGHTLCPNLIVAETALEWPLHDLYSARELCQMIPITGAEMYRKVMKANDWARDFLPNAFPSLRGKRSSTKQSPQLYWRLLRRPFQSLLIMTEWVLRGKLGDRFETWEMTRKIAKFSKQPGFGEETIFTAEVCQGNFHHHRKWMKELFQERLNATVAPAAVLGSDLLENPSSSPAMGAYL